MFFKKELNCWVRPIMA